MKQHYIMPVGVDDFRRVREEYYYVDKTNFIKSLIDGHSQATLITRPRRFGKTLALSMLYYFFTMENAKYNRVLFEGTDIEKAGEKYMALQGSKPTVLVSFKDIKQLNFSDMIMDFGYLMQHLYRSCKYLLESEYLDDTEKKYFGLILSRRANDIDLQKSLKNLTTWLCRYHKKPALVLIDEYDAPIQYAFDNGYYNEAVTFMRNYLSSVLKSNPDLDFAILTGVLRIAKESIFSSLNNLETASVALGRYQNVMGFDDNEIKQIAEDFHCSEKLSEIEKWYDGYNFSGVNVYNPWSVINYILHDCKPSIYWLNTSANSILKELLKRTDKKQAQELHSLLQGGSVSATINEGVIYSDIYKNSDALYTMLLTTGYLTQASEINNEEYDDTIELRIPNREVRTVYEKEIINRINEMDGNPKLLYLLKALLSGDVESFSEELNDYLFALVSYYDTANKESFYHGFVLGLMALLSRKYKILSNRESGYGRFDVAIFPDDKNKNGVIMEFKVAKNESELSQTAKNALSQIDNMEYVSEFKSKGIVHVWKYGIAFCGKKCEIAVLV
ncbi:MAG: AAA family ATPase [Selenomonadaceae bacterium]|nr:AAA family ATPase [Selenomonadaceae bacterium]